MEERRECVYNSEEGATSRVVNASLQQQLSAALLRGGETCTPYPPLGGRQTQERDMPMPMPSRNIDL